MIFRFLGMWAIRRAFRLLTEDHERPLRDRLTREAKRILLAAAITLAVLVAALIAVVAIVVSLAT